MTEDESAAGGSNCVRDGPPEACKPPERFEIVLCDGGSVAARDELAGVVDLFGALTREELTSALSELAFKQRAEIDDAAIAATIDDAIREYYLVETPAEAVRDGGGTAAKTTPNSDADDGAVYLTVGPTAFPLLPPNAEDLPYILDIPDRTVDRDHLASTVMDQLRADVTTVLEATDGDGTDGDGMDDDGTDSDNTIDAATLLDVTYDVETWATVDAAPIRAQLSDVIE